MTLYLCLSVCCAVTSILFIWLNTTAFQEYFSRTSIVGEFKDKREKDVTLTFIKFLQRDYDCYFVRLITCPYCLGAVLSILFGAITTSVISIPIFYVGSLLLYKLLSNNK